MKYQAIIFDLFGTLIDNFPPEEYQRVMAEMADALSVPHQEFARLWVGTFDKKASGYFATTREAIEHVCRTLGAKAGEAQIAAAVEIRFGLTRRSLVPRPGAVETLHHLRAVGHKIGLISDCSAEIPLLWPETPFAPLIESPVFSCSVGMTKPDSRIYLLACERLGVSPKDCLYVADGMGRELTGAAAVGISPVLIRVPYDRDYDHYRLDAKEWPGPVISALSEVPGLVRSGAIHGA